MSLIGSRYVEASDPGAVGAGYQWQDTTTGNLYERTTANDGWTYIYNVNEANGGNLPLTGGTMSGAIAGVTGWAPLDSPNFTTSAKLMGVNLSTANDLSSLQSYLESYISNQVTAGLATLSATGLNAYIACSTGTIDVTVEFNSPYGADGDFTVPLPYYSDGTQASVDECYILPTISIVDQTTDAVSSFINSWSIIETTKPTYNVRINHYTIGLANARLQIMYLVVAVRNTNWTS